jgi:hypothetical protein
MDDRVGFEDYYNHIRCKRSFMSAEQELADKTVALAIWNAAMRHSDACDTRYFDGLADGLTQVRETECKKLQAKISELEAEVRAYKVGMQSAVLEVNRLVTILEGN